MGGLSKGLAVIRAFSSEHAALTLSEVARSAGIPAATARRCLLTLEQLGYVTRNARTSCCGRRCWNSAPRIWSR
jgi:IclR family pca regulon transcriptional regulator